MSTEPYVLGTSDYELQRLALQQEVWGPVTADLLDRLELRPGLRCLDAGCGPGFVVEMLRQRVGAPAGRGGSVVALDASPRWIEHVRGRIEREGWREVEARCEPIETAELGDGEFDLIFLRWVLGFLADAGAVVTKLARALRPGGRLVVQDYNHEGVSVFPESEGFRALIRATRELYATRGGDPWIAGRLPRYLAAAGLVLELERPQVLCGGPGSQAFRWGDAFFSYHCHGMVEAGLLSAAERERFLCEWRALREDPGARFYSPIVVGAVARRPGPGSS